MKRKSTLLIFLPMLFLNHTHIMSMNYESRRHSYFNTFSQGTQGPFSSTTGKIITTIFIISAAIAWHYYKHVYLSSLKPPANHSLAQEESEEIDDDNENILEELTEKQKAIFSPCFNDERIRARYSEKHLITEIIPGNITQNNSFSERIIFGQELLQGRSSLPVLLICIHGTWSNATELGHIDSKQPVAYAIKQFARFLVQYKQTPVELISFNWSGALNPQARKEAGQKLAQEVMALNTEYAEIWTVAHSHGCNVVNHMAHELKKNVKKISPITSIHIASPIAHEESTYAQYIDRVYHFYSLADVTQLCGSIEAKNIAASLTDLFEHARTYDYDNVKNIRLQKNGFDVGHLQIKLPVLSYLPKMLFTIDTWYRIYKNIDLNIDNKFDCIACIRDYSKLHYGKHDSQDIMHAQEHSAQQKKLFVMRYGKNIEDKHINVEYVS